MNKLFVSVERNKGTLLIVPSRVTYHEIRVVDCRGLAEPAFVNRASLVFVFHRAANQTASFHCLTQSISPSSHHRHFPRLRLYFVYAALPEIH
jgi:hypothetical protein